MWLLLLLLLLPAPAAAAITHVFRGRVPPSPRRHRARRGEGQRIRPSPPPPLLLLRAHPEWSNSSCWRLSTKGSHGLPTVFSRTAMRPPQEGRRQRRGGRAYQPLPRSMRHPFLRGRHQGSAREWGEGKSSRARPSRRSGTKAKGRATTSPLPPRRHAPPSSVPSQTTDAGLSSRLRRRHFVLVLVPSSMATRTKWRRRTAGGARRRRASGPSRSPGVTGGLAGRGDPPLQKARDVGVGEVGKGDAPSHRDACPPLPRSPRR